MFRTSDGDDCDAFRSSTGRLATRWHLSNHDGALPAGWSLRLMSSEVLCALGKVSRKSWRGHEPSHRSQISMNSVTAGHLSLPKMSGDETCAVHSLS